MTFAIETKRLKLRDFQRQDIEPYISMCQDTKYQRFYDEEDCSTSKARELVQLFIAQALESPRSKYQLAVTLKSTGQFIGTCGLRLEGEHQASMGCGLARGFQTTGYALEAASGLIDFGFNHLDIHRIYADTIGKNRAAIRLCQSLGMRQEALFRENRYFKQQWWDTVIMALLKQEWTSR
ncbi:GNAT family N-acetyltransferase [Sansalvadorimonas sp. 2012CJ34-2]|uniref:GNAT family N-acetyltransferase n=1 Tax=Parendozoicomonas callyspongiae TaxID=2942213 RepID=A0ABT0PJN0_9GAMM|nr:GNAT family protein [Sansalvadorimonas sp. 2012CJ34-2]MCL6271594.1 GNAT family N-acetyltransferase [Sansalvadorimonas sp. 2012CJ34-2]